MGVKMNLRIITKNHAADPEIGFRTKSISKPYSRATAMPPACELIILSICNSVLFIALIQIIIQANDKLLI